MGEYSPWGGYYASSWEDMAAHICRNHSQTAIDMGIAYLTEPGAEDEVLERMGKLQQVCDFSGAPTRKCS